LASWAEPSPPRAFAASLKTFERKSRDISAAYQNRRHDPILLASVRFRIALVLGVALLMVSKLNVRLSLITMACAAALGILVALPAWRRSPIQRVEVSNERPERLSRHDKKGGIEMSCLVSGALRTVLALLVWTTSTNCPVDAMAAAHVHLFLFRVTSVLMDCSSAPRREERPAQAESSRLSVHYPLLTFGHKSSS